MNDPLSQFESTIRETEAKRKLKWFLLSVRSQKDLQKQILGRAENVLQVMKDGERENTFGLNSGPK